MSEAGPFLFQSQVGRVKVTGRSGPPALKQPAQGDKTANVSEFLLNPIYTDRTLYDGFHAWRTLSLSTHSSLQKCAFILCCLFYCLTILSHHSVSHIRVSFHEVPQKDEGGQEIFHAGLLTQL